MQIQLDSQDDVAVLAKTVGRITQSSLPTERDLFSETLGPMVYQRNLLLSLAESDYLDSSGVGWLLKCHKRFEKEGGKLVLHSVPPTVMQVLKVLRLQMVLRVAKDSVEARGIVLGEAA